MVNRQADHPHPRNQNNYRTTDTQTFPRMFASSALPPPNSFGHESRPLRLTSESARPQPQGGCHVQHSPPTQHQRCLCQTYQHNRSLPGNMCDCGHSACFHSPTVTEKRLSPDRVVGALVEKVKKLEDILIKERESRNSLISREKEVWEREIRVLREALAPLYQSDSEMKRRLAQIENKIDRNHDEQCRLKERMIAVDDTNMTLERRLEGIELSRSRKRKASPSREGNGVLSPESNYTYSSSSAASDAPSVSTQISPQPLSPINLPLPSSLTIASPRSSGVLQLKSGPMYSHAYHPHPHPRITLPSPHDGPRSSGFLSIDLAERLRKHKSKQPKAAETMPTSDTAGQQIRLNTGRTVSNGYLVPHQGRLSSGALPVSDLLSTEIEDDRKNRSPKRHKHFDDRMMALEILANATVESPLAH